MLRVEGTKILNENGDFKVKGISMIDIGVIGREYQQRIDIANKFWNINTVRLPVYPPVVPDRRSSFPFKPGNDLIEKNLIPMVEYCESHDLEVLVDWHQIADLSNETVDSALAFWQEAIPVLAEYSNVSFEIYNEPINSNTSNSWESTGETWATCKPYLETLVKEIRSMTDKMLIVPTPVYCRHPIAAAQDPITGYDNIAYSAHMYTPDVWVREGLEEFLRVNGRNVSDLPSQYTTVLDSHIQFNIDMIDHVKNASAIIPLIVTELGLNTTVDAFMTPFDKMVAETPNLNVVAWVLDKYWWPPLIKENGAITPFGRRIKTLFA